MREHMAPSRSVSGAPRSTFQSSDAVSNDNGAKRAQHAVNSEGGRDELYTAYKTNCSKLKLVVLLARPSAQPRMLK